MSANVKSAVGKVANYCGYPVELVEARRGVEVEYGEAVVYGRIRYEDGFEAGARLKYSEIEWLN